jgi:site-specific DNA recombinase
MSSNLSPYGSSDLLPSDARRAGRAISRYQTGGQVELARIDILFHYLKGMLFCERCHRAGRTGRLIYTEARGRGGELYGYFLCRGRQEKVCDLPYLPVAQVERAVESHYWALALPEDFIEGVKEMLRQTMAQQQESTQLLHDTLKKQLAKLAVQEERLIDLAADGALPQARIRTRLNQLALDRRGIEEKLGQTGEELAAGAELLQTSLELSREPAALYRRAPDQARRLLNDTYYERFYIDEDGAVADAELRSPFDEFRPAVAAYYRSRSDNHTEGMGSGGETPRTDEAPSGAGGLVPTSRTVSLDLAEVLSAGLSSKTVLAGLTGFEPATP